MRQIPTSLQPVAYASKRLGVKDVVVQKMARRGDFEGCEVRLGKLRFFDPVLLELWIERGGKPLASGRWAPKPKRQQAAAGEAA